MSHYGIIILFPHLSDQQRYVDPVDPTASAAQAEDILWICRGYIRIFRLFDIFYIFEIFRLFEDILGYVDHWHRLRVAATL